MLSLKTIGASSSSHKYYAKYCQEEGESQGVWTGQGASSLGLEGKVVEPDDMKQLLRGFDLSGKPLCKNAGEKHRGGWDLTFSAPKSFSIVWASVDEKTRQKMEEAVERAAEFSLGYIQEHAAFSRIGEGGKDLVKGKLVGSRFFHSSNRSGDPQCHVHLVVKNVAQCPDGQWRTLQGRHFFDHKMAAGSLFKLKLAEETERLGFRVRQGKDSFELVGVSDELVSEFSSRSKQIDEKLKEMGYTRETATAQMLEKVALDTRSTKHSEEGRRSFVLWRKTLEEKGFGLDKVYSLQGRSKVPELSRRELENIFHRSLDELTAQRSTFSQRELHHRLSENLIGKVTGDRLLGAMDEIRQHPRFIAISADRFTTSEMFKLEKSIVRSAILRENEGRHLVSEKAIEKVLAVEKFQTIKPEQLEALRSVARSKSSYSMIRGFAGVGKTYTIDAIERAYQEAGYRTIGCSLSHKAVQALRDETRMEAHTIHHLLGTIEAGSRKLGKKDVLFLDEAGMVDSRLMARLTEQVNRAGAKLILVGDEKQIQSVDAGGMFSTLYEHLGGGDLTGVVRQYRASERDAILAIREGEVEKTLKFYGGRRGVELNPNDIKGSIDEWAKLGQKGRLEALAPVLWSEKGSFEENLAVRGELIDQGRFKSSITFLNSEQKAIDLAAGDRILFSKSNARYGISSNEIGSVLSVSEERITYRSQSGKDQSFDPREFKDFTYGFVIKKSQYESEKGFAIEADLGSAINTTIERWKRFKEENPDKSSLIIASTNKVVGALNLEARKYLKESGEIGSKDYLVSTKDGELSVSIGEKLILTDTKRELGLYTNDVVTLKSVHDNSIVVQKKNDGHNSVEISFRLDQFNSFRHGYAITSHKSQAATVDRSFVLVDSKFFDREKFYVALSRSRNYAQIIVNKEILGDLGREKIEAIKALPKPERSYAYFKAFRDQTAHLLNRSEIKQTTQTGRTREDIVKLTAQEKRESAVKMMKLQAEMIGEKVRGSGQAIKQLIRASEKLNQGFERSFSEKAARRVKAKLRRAVMKF
ncbi:MAG: MobF family relaxase [Oligoflexus sp.]